MVKYNPKARASSSTKSSGSATDPTRGYANHDGPIRPGGDPRGDTIDYGPHRGGFTFDGLTSPRWSDRDPSFDYTQAQLDQEAAARQPYIDRRNEMFAGNDAYQQAKGAGDLKGQLAAMQQMRAQGQQDRFVAQGGTPETWQNRFDPNNNWPVPHVPGAGGGNGMVTPRSPSGNYQYGPGRPGPVPPGVPPQAAAQAQALPPSQNPMMQGYQGGGAGVSSGGSGQWGSAGGYNPGASTGSMGLYNDPSLYSGQMGGASPYASPMSMMALPYSMGGYNPNAATMGGMNPYLMSMMAGNQMSPAMQGFQGMNAFMMDPGMSMFGYSPMY